jgi:hypothetical protein
MTSNFLRPAIALAIALSLAGCGGKASFPITGTVFNLVYPGLVLSTNGMTVAVNPPATTFAFPNSLSYGEVYNVVPTSQPQHQSCTVYATPQIDTSGRVYTVGSDTAGRISTINIGVSCALNAYTIGGTINGLTSDGLVLTNGSGGGTVAPLTGVTTFTFAAAVSYGTSYGVTVLTQPANDVCSVTQNGTGVMGDAAVANIAVNCVPKT